MSNHIQNMVIVNRDKNPNTSLVWYWRGKCMYLYPLCASYYAFLAYLSLVVYSNVYSSLLMSPFGIR